MHTAHGESVLPRCCSAVDYTRSRAAWSSRDMVRGRKAAQRRQYSGRAHLIDLPETFTP